MAVLESFLLRTFSCTPEQNRDTAVYLEGGGQSDRRRDRGVLNPCARESKARTGRCLRGKLISDHGLSFSYEGQQEGANGQGSPAFFSEMNRALDGWLLARAPASPA